MIGDETQRKVRRAKRSDAAALMRVFAASWRFAYRGIIPEAHLECLVGRRDEAWWIKSIRGDANLLVLEISGEVVGYASCGASRDHAVYHGEIYELYLDPLYLGQGLGELLFEACRARLDKRGLDGLVVWVLEDNDIAQSFYWRRGGRPVARANVAFGAAKLGKIAYAWR